MKKDVRIYIAGHTGLLGSAIVRLLKQQGFRNLITKTRAELDLTDQKKVDAFFTRTKPKHVFCAMGRVGSMEANISYPAEFLYENIATQTNVLQSAYDHQITKLIFFGSNCMYPRLAKQPIKETSLLTGPLEPTNEAYAIAKIAGIKLCEYYNRQYNTDYITLVPASFYGPGDHFASDKKKRAHMIPLFIQAFHNAKEQDLSRVEIKDNPAKIREFIYVDDVAEAAIQLMKMDTQPFSSRGGLILNVGTGKEISVRELATRIKKIIGFKGSITWDKNVPKGMPRKVLDVTEIKKWGWHPRTNLDQGLKKTYQWFLARSIK